MFIIAAILLLITTNSFALTEEEFIQKIIMQNQYFEKNQIYVDIEETKLNTSLDNYQDWQINLDAQITNSKYDIDKDTNSKYTYTQNKITNKQSLKLDFEKKFLNNPGTFNANITRSLPEDNIVRYKKYNYYDDYKTNTYDTTYRVSYKYPLLKHDSNANSLKTYKRNIFDLQREKLDFDDAQENFLVDKLNQYLDWAKYQQIHKIYKSYLQKLLDTNLYNNKNSNMLKSQIARAKASIAINISKLQAQKKILATILKDNSILRANVIINYNKNILQITDNIDYYLKNNSRSMLKIAIDKKLKQIDINYYNNQKLPSLDIKLEAEKNHNKGNTLSTQYDNDSIIYRSSIIFNMPIGRDASSEENIHIARLSMRKLQIDYDKKLQDILSKLEGLNTEITLDKKALNQYNEIIAIITKNAIEQQQNYTNKKIKLNELINIYKEQRDIHLEYIAQVINYHKNMLKYDDLLDRVIQAPAKVKSIVNTIF